MAAKMSCVSLPARSAVIQPDMFGVFGNFGILTGIQNEVQWVWTKLGSTPRAWTADAPVDLRGLTRGFQIAAKQAIRLFLGGKKNNVIITQVLFLGRFRCMNNAWALAKALTQKVQGFFLSGMKNLACALQVLCQTRKCFIQRGGLL